MSGYGDYVNVGEDNFPLGSSWSLVDGRITLLEDYTRETYDQVTEYSEVILDLVDNLVIPPTDDLDVSIPENVAIDFTKRPDAGDVDISTSWPINTSNMDDWADVPSISPFIVPSPTFNSPNYDVPDKPIVLEVSDPGDAPIINNIIIPTKPNIYLPDSPTIDDILLPSPPNITLAEFEGTIPSDDLVIPNGFSYDEDAYNSDIWADLLSKVLNDIRNGGTGLDVDVEQEMYSRALNRQIEENEKLYREAEDYFSSRGFTIPPGAMSGKLSEISQQISRNNTEINGTVFVEQAKLAQTNTQFMVDKGIALEGITREFFNHQSNRSLDSAKAVASIGVEIFNASVSKYNAKISAYQTEAEVFKTKLQAASVEVDIYKSKVEASKVSADVQSILVDIYGKQISAMEAQMNLYTTEMESVKIASDIEAQKIEIFRVQTEAYVARINANKVRYEAYETEVKAEGVKASIYDSQVKAYISEIEASRAILDAEIAGSDQILKQNTLKIEKYKADLDGFSEEINSKKSQVNSQVDIFKSEVAAYASETDAERAYYQVQSDNSRLLMEQSNVKLQKAVAEVDAVLKGYISIKELQLKGNEGIMNVGAQLTSAAMNAINTSISYGKSINESNGETWSHSDTITEVHSFEENPT